MVESELFHRLARSGDAIVAIDHREKIVLWNKGAEELFEMPARSAIGGLCYEVLAGRDAQGNRYCSQACPVASQARDPAEQPVQNFPLVVKTGTGGTKLTTSALFALPNGTDRPLDTIVHVFREEKPAAWTGALPDTKEPASSTLSEREREVLHCLADADSVSEIAKKLSITEPTVRNHISGIREKLHVHTKLEAVVFAQKHHLL
jgi:DNA-binding CsgD family transcriptional regulator